MAQLHQAPNDAAAEIIRALAARHGIVYQATGYDVLAEQITCLSGDDVHLDPIELLLVELERAGHVEGREATLLHANYLRTVKYAPSAAQ